MNMTKHQQGMGGKVSTGGGGAQIPGGVKGGVGQRRGNRGRMRCVGQV